MTANCSAGPHHASFFAFLAHSLPDASQSGEETSGGFNWPEAFIPSVCGACPPSAPLAAEPPGGRPELLPPDLTSNQEEEDRGDLKNALAGILAAGATPIAAETLPARPLELAVPEPAGTEACGQESAALIVEASGHGQALIDANTASAGSGNSGRPGAGFAAGVLSLPVEATLPERPAVALATPHPPPARPAPEAWLAVQPRSIAAVQVIEPGSRDLAAPPSAEWHGKSPNVPSVPEDALRQQVPTLPGTTTGSEPWIETALSSPPQEPDEQSPRAPVISGIAGPPSSASSAAASGSEPHVQSRTAHLSRESAEQISLAPAVVEDGLHRQAFLRPDAAPNPEPRIHPSASFAPQEANQRSPLVPEVAKNSGRQAASAPPNAAPDSEPGLHAWTASPARRLDESGSQLPVVLEGVLHQRVSTLPNATSASEQTHDLAARLPAALARHAPAPTAQPAAQPPLPGEAQPPHAWLEEAGGENRPQAVLPRLNGANAAAAQNHAPAQQPRAGEAWNSREPVTANREAPAGLRECGHQDNASEGDSSRQGAGLRAAIDNADPRAARRDLPAEAAGPAVRFESALSASEPVTAMAGWRPHGAPPRERGTADSTLARPAPPSISSGPEDQGSRGIRRELTVRLDAGSDRRVDLQFVETRGAVNLRLRTQDQQTADALRGSIAQMESDLNARGWKAELTPARESSTGMATPEESSRGLPTWRMRSGIGISPAEGPQRAATDLGDPSDSRRRGQEWPADEQEILELAALRRLAVKGGIE